MVCVKKFFTMEDLKMALNIFCCVYGVGTLGMPGNFSRAGPVLAIIGMAFMAFANVYASVAICRVMLLAPRNVKTYGDLGEWCMGKWGRWLSVISQMASCVLLPCVYLVLGGTLLDGLFSGAFSTTYWICFMALMCLPVCLIPTLKEGAGVAFAGCAGTLIADIIGVAVVMYGMRGHPSPPSPDIKFSQVAGMFGNLSLAYNAGIVIPALQRQHSEPARMPRVVFVTMAFISVLFLIFASTAYSAVGCQIAGNLLYAIYPDSNGLTILGFKSDWGAVVMAYFFMQLHITIAFSVVLNPAFYLAERLVLKMHQKKEDDVENALTYDASSYAAVTTPDKDLVNGDSSKISYISNADAENPHYGDAVAEAAEYRGVNAIKYVILRVTIIVMMTILSISLKDHFSDLVDFVGASCITLISILLPIIFLLKKLWKEIPLYEKIPALIVVIVCGFLGCYVTYTSGKTLFAPTDSGSEFPYCDSEFENSVYYNYTAVHGV
ncbi:Amino Acid/Auxin Permease [Phytophthora megakarya]|uniref:Amino Acid/Auxin Permease n=1 Tax=Phytophthora megakarya TaxID=4795 RepID=A0A225VBJ0_9STRA|nr:Amino Acid/Auxin Permease [Phytophthora megakarya]